MAQLINNLENGVGGFAKGLLSSMHVATVIPMSTIIAPVFSADKTGKGEIPGSELAKNGRYGGATLAFLGKVMAYNAASSLVQTVSGGLEALVAEAMFIMGKFWYYKFLINPSNFRMTTNKLQTVEETSDLTIINTYRNASPTMTFTGVSGCTLNRTFMELLDPGQDSLPTTLAGALVRYPKLSTAYLKFRQLEKFYNETNSDVVIIYDMDLYVGKLSAFNFNMDAQNPWVINYDLTFRLYPGLNLHTFSIYDYKPFFQELMNRYGSTFAKDFEGKSKASYPGKK